MAETWTVEATDRVKQYLNAIASGQYLDNFTKMTRIAKTVCEAEGIAQQNPLKL